MKGEEFKSEDLLKELTKLINKIYDTLVDKEKSLALTLA